PGTSRLFRLPVRLPGLRRLLHQGTDDRHIGTAPVDTDQEMGDCNGVSARLCPCDHTAVGDHSMVQHIYPRYDDGRQVYSSACHYTSFGPGGADARHPDIIIREQPGSRAEAERGARTTE